MRNFRLLSTKELNPQQKRRFIEWGCLLTAYNFIRIKALEFDSTTLHENLIFTSQNGVNAFFKHCAMQEEWKEKSVFCVGEKTKTLLQKKGFNVIHTEENAAALSKRISLQHEDSFAYTFLCGKKRRPEIESFLKKQTLSYNCIETYATHLQSKSFGVQDGILFFSPSGVESYLQTNEIKKAQCFAIGKTTASYLTPYSNQIHVAKKPTIEHLGLCVHQYLNSK